MVELHSLLVCLLLVTGAPFFFGVLPLGIRSALTAGEGAKRLLPQAMPAMWSKVSVYVERLLASSFQLRATAAQTEVITGIMLILGAFTGRGLLQPIMSVLAAFVPGDVSGDPCCHARERQPLTSSVPCTHSQVLAAYARAVHGVSRDPDRVFACPRTAGPYLRASSLPAGHFQRVDCSVQQALLVCRSRPAAATAAGGRRAVRHDAAMHNHVVTNETQVFI